MRRERMPRAAALAALCALLLAGCGLEVTKAGEGAVPGEVTIGTADVEGRAASDEVEFFAASVEAESGRALRVDIAWEAHTARQSIDEPYGYETIGEMVRDGELELALVPDFVWVQRGASRLAAIKTPFLVTTDELMLELAQSELATEMIADVSAHGVHGLALLPESLRHPIGFAEPVIGLDDYAGQTFRSIDSEARRLFAAFGGEGVFLDGERFWRAVNDGELRGTESAFVHVPSYVGPGVFTGDVTFFAKTHVLVANAAWWESLGDSERAAVERAAGATVDDVVSHHTGEAVAAARACESGSRIVFAGDEVQAELREAAQPVRDALASDPVTADMIARIEALAATLPPPAEAVAACEGPLPSIIRPPEDSDETALFPQGTYRTTVSVEDFTDRGVDLGTARGHAGVWTLGFRDGKVSIDCPGSRYVVHDGRVSILMGSGDEGCGTAANGELFSASWTLTGDVLRFTEVRSGVDGPGWQDFHEALWGSQPWQRIG